MLTQLGLDASFIFCYNLGSMLNLEMIDSMASMCRDQNLKFIQGDFKAYRNKNIEEGNEEAAGTVKTIVADTGNFVMWFMDSENGVLTGTCKTTKRAGRFAAGPKTTADQKRETIAEIISEILD